MSIIDRYLLRQFMTVLLGTFLMLFGIYMVFELLDKMDQFDTVARQTHQWFGQVLVSYYVPRMFSFFELTGGGLMLLASILTVSSFKRYHELTALATAGIPPTRCFRAIFFGIFLIALLGIANREIMLPRVLPELIQDIGDLQQQTESTRMIPPIRDYFKIQFQGKGCNLRKQEIYDLSLELPQHCLPGGTNQISAKIAMFEPHTPGLPSGFRLRTITQPSELPHMASIELVGTPIILTAHDYPDLLASEECFVATNLLFEQMIDPKTWGANASTQALFGAIRRAPDDFGATARTQYHFRILRPITDLTVVFLGLPLMIRRDDRRMFRALLVSGLLPCLCVGCGFLFQWLGNSSRLTPEFAAWMPILIFTPIAVALYRQINS